MTTATNPGPSVARGGAFSLLGSINSALMGFILVVVLGRAFGPSGAGAVLQGVAAFTIALGVARFGLDTTAVWILPRLGDTKAGTGQVRPAVIWLLLPGLILGLLSGTGLYLAGTVAGGDVGQIFQAMSWCMPAAAMMTIALGATRGLGGVRPYVLINSMLVPTARPTLVAAVALVGGGTAMAGVAWALPFVAGMALSLILLSRLVVRAERKGQVASEAWWPQRHLRGAIRRYSLPRSVAVILEQAMLWLDVLLVGLLAGPSAAGIYGAATRFVAAGRIVSTALRIVVAPLYSRMLGRDDRAGVQELYTTTTTWIVLFSMPIYAIYAVFGETLLSILGPGFQQGAGVMAVLSVGLTITLLGGNIQVVLLMSGMSGRVAIFKALSLITLVLGMVVAIPLWGIVGGALAWSLSVTVDTVLAATTAVRRLGLSVGGFSVLLALFVGGVLPAILALSLRIAMGEEPASLLTAVAVGGVVMAALSILFRRRLHLEDIMRLVKGRDQKA